jgi:hypothetical protein
LEWSDEVTDVREQFPLLPRAETEKIADELNVPHPQAPGAPAKTVMTTDFLISTKDGQKHARTVKLSQQLESDRTTEKLEIERLYWSARRVDWAIVTENELNPTLAKNVSWVYPKFRLDQLAPLTSEDVKRVGELLRKAITTENDRLTSLTNHFDSELGLNPGSCLSIVRHLIATKQWRVDMYTAVIEPSNPLQLITTL